MEFFTVKEFAAKLKFTPHAILKAIKMGKIYAVRPSVGKKSAFRIPESELERLQLQAMCEGKNDK